MRQKVSKKHVYQELLPGSNPELLKALHLLTRDGDLNADARRKLKQINHFIRILTPHLDDMFERHANPVLVDCGSGKSSLGFILYELFFQKKEQGHIVSIESNEQFSNNAQQLASLLHFERMRFYCATIEHAKLDDAKIHCVTALHACDTATDDAIILALQHQAQHIALVPCCQAQVAKQLNKQHTFPQVASVLFEHNLHKREFGSHLTNVIRSLVLRAAGYQVTVTEFTGFEHTLKNELILAKKIQAYHQPSIESLNHLLNMFQIEPKIITWAKQHTSWFTATPESINNV